jgi:hypothetical protein
LVVVVGEVVGSVRIWIGAVEGAGGEAGRDFLVVAVVVGIEVGAEGTVGGEEGVGMVAEVEGVEVEGGMGVCSMIRYRSVGGICKFRVIEDGLAGKCCSFRFQFFFAKKKCNGGMYYSQHFFPPPISAALVFPRL